MIVDKKEYYHIHKILPEDSWMVGKQITFDKSQYNYFFTTMRKDCTRFLYPEYRKDFSNSRQIVENADKLIKLIEKLPDINQ